MRDGSRPRPGVSRHGGAGTRALALAALLGGCGEKIQDQYGVQIVGPVGMDYLAGARTVVLELDGRELSRTAINPGQPFSVTGSGIDTGATTTGAVGVRALDASGATVAYGQSPDIELTMFSYSLLVFVQKPGSFGQTLSLDVPRRDMIGVSAVADPPPGTGAAPITVAFFGLGKMTRPVLVPNTTMAVPMELPSDDFWMYNPLQHSATLDDVGFGGSIGGVAQPRTGASALVRADGRTIYVFGGQVTEPMAAPRATSQLDVLRVVRSGFSAFAQQVLITARTSDKPGIARSGAVLADADATYAFGGEADGTELDTVVVIDPSATDAFQLLDARMGARRTGHTVTAVNTTAVPEILVVGGGSAEAVAEVFVPTPMPHFLAPAGDAGPPRRDHRAILLSPDRILIVGGKNADGTLGDSLVYSAKVRELAPGPITLATPRSEFAAFVVETDLVIAGGVDAAGARIGKAEVFDMTDDRLRLKGEVPCEPRSGATAMVLSNGSAVIAGGTGATGDASRVIEIYQPFR
jgi:hypothetical protein